MIKGFFSLAITFAVLFCCLLISINANGGMFMLNVNAAGKEYKADSTIISKMTEYEEKLMSNSGTGVSNTNIEKSVYNLGNRAMVANVIKKAMDGKDITLVAFGGSITQNAGSGTKPNGITHSYTDTKCYVQLVGDWFSDMFKSYGGKVKMVNAGIGATDTVFGIHRMNEDVLKHNPDLVILEWDKNDDNNDVSKQATYENMIRKFLDKGIAVVMLGMCGVWGDSSQQMHEPLAKHYDLPYISYRDAFKGESYFTKLTNDTVHPNIVGHHLTGLILNAYFADVYKDIDKLDSGVPKVPSAPYNKDATIYGEGSMAKLSDIEEGRIKGIKLVSKGSFAKEGKITTHGGRTYNAYIAKYATSYQPMVLEIKDVQTLFFMVKRSYGISDGAFKIKIDGKEVTDKTFTSSHSSAADSSQIENTYIWATARAFYSAAKKNIKVEIYPTNKEAIEYVGIYGLFLTGNFDGVIGSTSAGNTSQGSTGNTSQGNVGNISQGSTASQGGTVGKPTASKNEITASDNTTVNDESPKDSEIKKDVIDTEIITEEKDGFLSGPKGFRNFLIILGSVIAVAAVGIIAGILIKKRKSAADIS